jgi:putative polyhydroxyalkanoate system protein
MVESASAEVPVSRIVIHRPHGLAPKALRRLAETIARRLQRQYGGTFRRDGDRLTFSQIGASGHVAVDSRAIEVLVEIGFLLRPLRGRIEEEIHRFLDQHLQVPAAPVSRPTRGHGEPVGSSRRPAPSAEGRPRGRRASP